MHRLEKWEISRRQRLRAVRKARETIVARDEARARSRRRRTRRWRKCRIRTSSALRAS